MLRGHGGSVCMCVCASSGVVVVGVFTVLHVCMRVCCFMLVCDIKDWREIILTGNLTVA